eukprot:TRINITY_DN2907_c0_g1_i1.p1 TRINITY_DN2907_c0_g1~~TRINITY_DN2907_c0_g1_i1.p1  ORF type:complete len:565 (+),score=6.32 TRINITY_DN2907_c0_g1_i1:30-1724(+)
MLLVSWGLVVGLASGRNVYPHDDQDLWFQSGTQTSGSGSHWANSVTESSSVSSGSQWDWAQTDDFWDSLSPAGYSTEEVMEEYEELIPPETVKPYLPPNVSPTYRPATQPPTQPPTYKPTTQPPYVKPTTRPSAYKPTSKQPRPHAYRNTLELTARPLVYPTRRPPKTRYPSHNRYPEPVHPSVETYDDNLQPAPYLHIDGYPGDNDKYSKNFNDFYNPYSYDDHSAPISFDSLMKDHSSSSDSYTALGQPQDSYYIQEEDSYYPEQTSHQHQLNSYRGSPQNSNPYQQQRPLYEEQHGASYEEQHTSYDQLVSTYEQQQQHISSNQQQVPSYEQRIPSYEEHQHKPSYEQPIHSYEEPPSIPSYDEQPVMSYDESTSTSYHDEQHTVDGIYSDNQAVTAYQVNHPDVICQGYTDAVMAAIELIDVKNETCEEQYQNLRSNIEDLTMFDFCLEVAFIKGEAFNINLDNKKRQGKFFFDFSLDVLFGGKDKDDDYYDNGWRGDGWCTLSFCDRCSRRGSCCRRWCQRMWYDTDYESYSCRPQYCRKNRSSIICRKCRHCYCDDFF